MSRVGKILKDAHALHKTTQLFIIIFQIIFAE